MRPFHLSRPTVAYRLALARRAYQALIEAPPHMVPYLLTSVRLELATARAIHRRAWKSTSLWHAYSLH